MAPSGGGETTHLHIWRELGLQGYPDEFHGFTNAEANDPTKIELVPPEAQGCVDTKRIVAAAVVIDVKPCSVAADILPLKSRRYTQPKASLHGFISSARM